MLAQFLNSKPKSALINLFLAHPQRSFSLTEARVVSGCGPSLLIKDTVKELEKMDFLVVTKRKNKKYYQVNKHFPLYPELLQMLRKVKSTPKDLLALAARRVGELKFVALSGIFVGKPRLDADVLFVGKVSNARMQKFLKLAEKFAEQEVNYAVLTASEFEYRKIMSDRFVKNILENNPLIIINTTRTKIPSLN